MKFPSGLRPLLWGLLLFALPLSAQIGIGTTTFNADPSAALEIQSTDKGFLVPRMTSMQRTDITSPAIGLLVFDTETESFWYYETNGWIELLLQGGTQLIDADQDTKIEFVEDVKDEIVFTLDGTPHLRLVDGRLETMNLFRSVFLGGGAGKDDPVNSDLRNIAIGDSSLQRNLSGRFSNAIGYKALEDNTSGRNNVANGFFALGNNTTGQGNIGIGDFANQKNTVGFDNIAIGRDADMVYDSLTNAVAIGYNTKAAQNNSIILGENSNVGIGTSSPDAKLHVVGDIRIEDGTQQDGSILVSDANGVGTWQPGGQDNLGNHTATQELFMNEKSIVKANRIELSSTVPGTKISLNIQDGSSTNAYAIEILNNQNYGLLSNTGYKMVETGFTSTNAHSDMGWVWRRNNQTDDQGLMSLSGNGKLTVAGTSWFQSDVGIGYTDDSSLPRLLSVSGNIKIDGDLILNEKIEDRSSSVFNFLSSDGSSIMAYDQSGIKGEAAIGNGVINDVRLEVKEDVTTTDGNSDNFPVFISNAANPTNQNDRANGLLIKAGRDSYQNNAESHFMSFARPQNNSGSYNIIGKIKQNGGSSIAYNTSSDVRLKHNIKPSSKGLTDLLQIEVADYNYKDDRPSDRRQGFLAQQLYEFFPYAVDPGGEDPKDQPWMVDYGMLTPILVQAIQDRQEIIKQHQIEIQHQQSTIDALKTQVEELDLLKAELSQLKQAILQSASHPTTSK